MTMLRVRSTSALLAIVLVWMAAAPVLAITCLPGRQCPMAGMAGAQRLSAAAGHAVVTSLDCCLHSERRSEPGTMQPSVAQHFRPAVLLAHVTLLEFLATVDPRHLGGERQAASEVPLYTLHSILLI
ncbi:MAG TPA: hypothetical protein VGV61_15170 [Thermoanaerobaculia bacterium]|jgi:hypothetical protein|nr:hypothetical protein [Thermoanaerobaculia bacterium]